MSRGSSADGRRSIEGRCSMEGRWDMYEAPRVCSSVGGVPMGGNAPPRPTLGDAVAGKYAEGAGRALSNGGEFGAREGLVGGCIDSGDDGSLADPNEGRRCSSGGVFNGPDADRRSSGGVGRESLPDRKDGRAVPPELLLMPERLEVIEAVRARASLMID